MCDEMRDPLWERMGPIVLRLLALISVAVIAIPIGLIVLLPFAG